MNYSQSLEFLFNLERFGVKLSLENILSLMRKLGNPHLKFPSLHIAGTNGKGSCSAMLHSVLNRAGYKTSLYTSPHLINFGERIRIGDSLIEKDLVVDLISDLKTDILKKRYTFFEVTTALAFYYFALKKVELAVVETGLGGRLDCTNILKPEVAIITNIGMEHTNSLGRTLGEIAQEKGGIIKENVPTVTSVKRKIPLRVIESLCRKKNSDHISVFKESKWKIIKSSIKGTEFDLSTRKNNYAGVKLNLAGEHQITNAACAILTLENLKQKFININNESIISGLREVKWVGRLDIYRENPLVLLDVAHNPDGVRNLVKSLKRLIPDRKINFLFGVMQDKDYKNMLKILGRIANEIILIQVQYHRSAKLESLINTAKELKLRYRAIPDLNEAYLHAIGGSAEDEILCITGSHFIVGEFLSRQKSGFQFTSSTIQNYKTK